MRGRACAPQCQRVKRRPATIGVARKGVAVMSSAPDHAIAVATFERRLHAADAFVRNPLHQPHVEPHFVPFHDRPLKLWRPMGAGVSNRDGVFADSGHAGGIEPGKKAMQLGSASSEDF